MPPRFPRATMLFWAALLGGCGSTVYLARPIPVSQHGSFRFTDRVSEATPTIVVEGEFTIRADTILAQMTTGYCRPVIPPSTQYFRLECGQVSLSFDRSSPLQHGNYVVQGTAMEVRRVCMRYGPNSSGQQVCLQYGQETVQVVRNFGGRIRPIPIT